jgi:hypothetical protein
MTGVRDDVAFAVARKQVPAFTPGRMRDLCGKLGLASPVSLRALSGVLNNLPAAFVHFPSGPMTAGTLHAEGELYVQSDGIFSFIAHLHESGGVGDNYIFGVALPDVRDPDGNALAFVQDGWIAGQLDFGPSSRDWHNDGVNPLLRDQWDIVKNLSPGRVSFRLRASTNPLQVTETVLFAVGLLVLGGYGQSKCKWESPYYDQDGRFHPPTCNFSH